MTQIYKISATAATARRIDDTRIVRVDITLSNDSEPISLQVGSWICQEAKDFAAVVRNKVSSISSSIYSRRRASLSSKNEEKVCVLDPSVLYITEEDYEDADGNSGTRRLFVTGSILRVETRNIEEEQKASFEALSKNAKSATISVVNGKLVLAEAAPKKSSRGTRKPKATVAEAAPEVEAK